MEIIKTHIEGLLILKPKKFEDERGYFVESYNQQKFNYAVGEEIQFVQDNESVSSLGVVRGLHFQKPPFAQGKLVRVARGRVLDVAVDIRQDSPTYGQWHSELLSEENGKQFWIPPGFAHGFAVLADNTKFLYKCTSLYNPDYEETILWNDKQLKIDWKINHAIISEKDKKGVIFGELNTMF